MITNLQKEFWTQLTRMHDRLPHAMLIHGAAGVGKLALAERFAQLLLCEHPGQGAKPGQGANPCGGCEGCRWFLAGNHPDVRIVEPEALALVRPAAVVEESKEEQAKEKKKPSLQIKIEQTRGLADFLNLASHRGGRRVAIIHPAEDMNTATANALLKSLEEPPLGAFFFAGIASSGALAADDTQPLYFAAGPTPGSGGERGLADRAGGAKSSALAGICGRLSTARS